MIGSELETVLGGAYSAISRDLMVPIINRTVYLMLQNKEIDERLTKQFSEDGILSVEIVTGLQALSRDTDLQKLMQMGEMVRNLPEESLRLFKWDEYAKQLVTAIGFDSNNWIKSEEDVQQQQMKMEEAKMAMQQKMQQQQTAQQAMTDVASNVATEAGVQDIQQTGGQNIQELLQNPEMMAQLQGMMGGSDA